MTLNGPLQDYVVPFFESWLRAAHHGGSVGENPLASQARKWRLEPERPGSIQDTLLIKDHAGTEPLTQYPSEDIDSKRANPEYIFLLWLPPATFFSYPFSSSKLFLSIALKSQGCSQISTDVNGYVIF